MIDFFRSIHDQTSLRRDRLEQWLARQQEKIHARTTISKDGQFVTSGGFQIRRMVDGNGFAQSSLPPPHFHRYRHKNYNLPSQKRWLEL
jgi:hypothetical protein